MIRSPLHRVFCVSRPSFAFLRSLHGGTHLASKQQLPPRIKVDENDLSEKFIKGGGPGGQKINKTSSQVQLTHIPTGIQIRCQATRSRSQNRTIARRMLADRIEEQQKGDDSRTSIKAAAKKKKAANSIKKKRRKYRKLAEEAQKESSREHDDEDVEEEEEEDPKESEDNSQSCTGKA